MSAAAGGGAWLGDGDAAVGLGVCEGVATTAGVAVGTGDAVGTTWGAVAALPTTK